MAADLRIDGEEALIQSYFAPLAVGFPGALGLKDDCAALQPLPGEELVLTTDAIAAGIHFFPDDDAGDVAWKALAVNVSDLVAKGARPVAYLMALAFPEPPLAAWLEKFTSGLAAAQTAFGMHLAGGDTDRRPGPLAINITAVGVVPQGRFVRRATASPLDRIFVTGTVGDAALGLKLRSDPTLAASWRLGDEDTRALVTRYLRPSPPLALRQAILDHASAAIDISDGLAKDLDRLARLSGLRAVVRGSDLPLSAAARSALVSTPALFENLVTGGDDYQVLASVPEASAEEFKAAAREAQTAIADIGWFERGDGVKIDDRQGVPLRLHRLGWDHLD